MNPEDAPEVEHSDECEPNRYRDNVGYLAGQALQGILASDTERFRTLTFGRVVELAAQYGEALAKRLDEPPTGEQD